jgi:hypothetical protein
VMPREFMVTPSPAADPYATPSKGAKKSK